MGDWPMLPGGAVVGRSTIVGGSSLPGPQTTANASANAKGAWTELMAAAPAGATGLLVEVIGGSGSMDGLVDIAIGAAGSEVIIAADLITCRVTDLAPAVYMLPIPIPVGERISARSQSTTASVGCYVGVHLLGGGFLRASGGNALDTYGANAADSGGTSIDPGTTLHTKGAWVEFSAATARDIKQLIVGCGNQVNLTRANADFLIDVGVGASGSEQVVLPDLYARAGAGADLIEPHVFPPLPVDIPAGSRLAARAQCGITTATNRLLDLILYGAG